MTTPMTPTKFDRLGPRDFENGAVKDEIAAALVEGERRAVECRRLRTAIGEILSCHAVPGQTTHLCPKCEDLANAGARGLLTDMTVARAAGT